MRGKRAVPLRWASWVGRGTETGQQQHPMLSLSCRSTLGLHDSPAPFSAHFPHQPPPLGGLASCSSSNPSFWGISVTQGCQPLVPFMGRWVRGGEWSQPSALLRLLGLCNPRMFKKAQ